MKRKILEPYGEPSIPREVIREAVRKIKERDKTKYVENVI